MGKRNRKNKNNFYYAVSGELVHEKTECFNWLKFIYINPIGNLVRFILNKKFISIFYGFLQKSKLSKRKIKPFIKKHNINMNEFETPSGGYQSFNDFFIRKLKTGARFIDQDPAIIVSPADSKLFVIPHLSDETIFFVKNKKFNLESLLKHKELAQRYVGGTIMVFRLAPYDYHRYHFPFDCQPSSPKLIHGLYDSVNPIVYKAGYQPLTENERQLIMLKTDKFFDVAMVCVGAMMVGKIKQTYTPNKQYKKGDEVGYFEFGGSSLILLFKSGLVVPKEVFINNSLQGFETEVKMGQAVTL
jgi:phosphatidylserine decarboxylase